MQQSRRPVDALPCRHDLDVAEVDSAIALLRELPAEAADALADRGIPTDDWDMLLRAAVESMRGTFAATTSDKERFIEAVLDYGVEEGALCDWQFVGTANRQDYRVELPDGVSVCIEAKGCPDGNNTTIWERPTWADEFVVWFLCPESLVKDPGKGVWSGIATRLMPKIASDRTVVDAVMFWDGRCGSARRRCPKQHGVVGPLRKRATDIAAQSDRPDWLPPPCVYLMPSTAPHLRNNQAPRVHSIDSCRFAQAMLALFEVPRDEMPAYVHEAHISIEGTAKGSEIEPAVVSRCWPNGEERRVSTGTKPLRRE